LRDARLPESLEGLGQACFLLDAGTQAIESREEAYRLYHEQGNRLGAARVARGWYWDYRAFRGEAAVSNGWLQRAASLLEGLESSMEFGWLQYRKAQAALFGGHDPATARALAGRCRDVARANGSRDLEIGALALEGLAWVTEGDPVAGRQRLDESMASIIGGEVTDITIIGLASCHLIAACEKMHDHERATQWCERLKVFSAHWRLLPLFAICRTLYAGLCTTRGIWQDAETALIAASGELASTHRGAMPEALARLGELRRRQGRAEEAMELFGQAGLHPVAVLGQAALELDRDRPLEARELIARYLRRVAPQDCTARTTALALLARAASALSDREAATGAATELDTIAERLGTDPIRAMAAGSRGIIALTDGDVDAARTAFEDALDFYTQAGMPFEAGRARVDRARALEAAGRTADAAAELRHAVRTFESIGASGEAARAGAVPVRVSGRPPGHGVAASAEAQNALERLTDREREVLTLIGQGLSNQEIAGRLDLSPHTIHRHVSNILTKLDLPSRAAAAVAAARAGTI
jgi:DNA-binding CsgD family transcriptional regulator